ncbi:MAG: RNA 2',3'-cyclic phosphodiesterase [Myxococcales bacterium]
MARVRTFVALTLETGERDVLARLSRDLHAVLPQSGALRPTRPEQLHLTTAFLGHTDTMLIPTVSSIISEVAARRPAPVLEGAEIVYLPHTRHVRVVALAFSDREQAAAGLAQELEERLTPLGFAFEQRPFLPHVTLLRSGKPFRAQPDPAWLARQKLEQIVLRLGQLTYYASHLEAKGARHEVLSSALLGTSLP